VAAISQIITHAKFVPVKKKENKEFGREKNGE
jgi:hypothetical protein